LFNVCTRVEHDGNYSYQYGSTSKKLKIEQPYDPVMELLGIFKRNQRQHTTELLETMLLAALLTKATP
jgi:hypothetical protein